METEKKKWGGCRPGAGRPCHGSGRKIPTTVMLSPEGRKDLEYLKDRAVDTNTIVDRGIRQFAEFHRTGEIPTFEESE